MNTVRRFLLLTFLVVSLVVVLSANSAVAGDANAKPNILVIITDDAGYVDFGCYGGTQIPTPSIDSIAQRGVRFTNGYVTASVCCPSRAGLLTGRYQQRFGHEFNGPEAPLAPYTAEQMGLSLDERTIGAALQPYGYRTMAIGKWHMGNLPHFFPLERGFDEFLGFQGGSRSYFPVEGRIADGQKIYRDREVVPEESFEYTTDLFTDAAVDFIDRHADRPFFIYLSYNAVHSPMHAKEEDLAAFKTIEDDKRRTYAGMDRSLDQGIGRVLATLERHAILDDTLIFFINDNGGATNNGSDNGPLRGMKGSKWEGGVRVPFMVQWPARLQGGTTYDEPVIALDVLATAIAAAGGDPSDAPLPLDGVDLLPYLSGEKDGAPHETLFWRRGVAAACRQGDWKIIRSEGNPTLLFNLASDLGETTNVADEHPEIVQRLSRALAEWEKDLAPPRWKEGERWSKNQIMKHRMDVIGRDMERKYP